MVAKSRLKIVKRSFCICFQAFDRNDLGPLSAHQRNAIDWHFAVELSVVYFNMLSWDVIIHPNSLELNDSLIKQFSCCCFFLHFYRFYEAGYHDRSHQCESEI